jgi:hypothetical protein
VEKTMVSAGEESRIDGVSMSLLVYRRALFNHVKPIISKKAYQPTSIMRWDSGG